MATSTTSDTRLNVITRRVRLRGLTPIMFDRYAGDNQTKLTWDQKIYLRPGTNELVLPALNIISFFTAHNTNSAPKRLRDKRVYKGICNAILSFCSIQGADGDVENITFTRDGKPITVGAFSDRSEPQSGLYLHRAVARLDKGIPNPKITRKAYRQAKIFFSELSSSAWNGSPNCPSVCVHARTEHSFIVG